jgi:hypothetical protein
MTHSSHPPYTQAVCSLPLNGGSYNILLNATTKGLAAVCACLSVLSYLATGVVSAVSQSLLEREGCQQSKYSHHFYSYKLPPKNRSAPRRTCSPSGRASPSRPAASASSSSSPSSSSWSVEKGDG